MGQSTSCEPESLQITDRSFSYIVQPSSRSSSTPNQKAIKTVTVDTIQQLNLLKENFDFRLKNRGYLTHCYGFEVLQVEDENNFPKFSCISGFSSMKVNFHYEKITQKFSQLYQIPIQAGLKLLAHCLRGFSILYDHFGYFTPESRHINKQGDEWKVWINENIFTLKSKNKQQLIKRHASKQKFLQQVIHLFDALRDDEQPEFSYSVFIYGKTEKPQFLPCLKLSQILELINQSVQNQKILRSHRHRTSLKRLNLSSSETVRRAECNTLMSFDQKCNQITKPKFITNNKNLSRSIYESSEPNRSSKQNAKKGISNSRCQTQHQNLDGYCHKSLINHLEQRKNSEPNDMQKLRKVPSKIIRNKVTKEAKENQPIKNHMKDQSLASTTSNCTGWTKNFTPLKMLEDHPDKQVGVCHKNFVKREKSHTNGLTSQEKNRIYEEILRQPIKITENSQVSSESDQMDFGNRNFDQAFLPSDQFLTKQENQQLDRNQAIQMNPFSNTTPSIAHKTPYCGKQAMKILKECLLNNSKCQHRRSMTDQTHQRKNQPKVKYCCSQQFDSEFPSVDSKNDDVFPTKPEFISENINYVQHPEHIEKQKIVNDIGHGQKDLCEDNQQEFKKSKHVKIANEDHLSIYSYQKESDSLYEKSNVGQLSQNQNEASMPKLPNFKSEGGIKGLLRNKRLNTLKSINQIEVDYAIDEDILGDLNKMFQKHRFAKSTKLTKLQEE